MSSAVHDEFHFSTALNVNISKKIHTLDLSGSRVQSISTGFSENHIKNALKFKE